MENGTRNRKGAHGRTSLAPYASGRRTRVTQTRIRGLASPEFALVREVQVRATGASIHALSQQLQIYVSAVECGAMLQARAAEAALRVGWRRAGRRGE